MKNYVIKVNGNIYHVEVEEKEAGSPTASFSQSMPVKKEEVSANTAVEKKAEAPALASGEKKEGSIKITAPMPGKILALKAQPGQQLKAGEALLILEAMKMENEIVAPEAGSLVSIHAAVGDHVEVGQLLATLE
ncbi:MAG: biotin/lipoyl-containing protein [Johnsonella sp.]|nr:biotin/lipoyl-containing protein [Johnsonella sp.]